VTATRKKENVEVVELEELEKNKLAGLELEDRADSR
jgi:hypothetical protein